jgi:hypothetical protein
MRATEYAGVFADSEPRGLMEKRRRFLPPPSSTAESSRDVSDPTSGTLTLTPGSVTGSLTSRLRV